MEKGNMQLELMLNDKKNLVDIPDIYYAPGGTSTLISGPKLNRAGYCLDMQPERLIVYGPDKRCLGIIPLENDQHSVEWGRMAVDAQSHWPKILLYVNLDQMEEKEYVTCALTKIKCLSVPAERTSPKAEKFDDHLHMDIWGPAKTQTIGHARYALTIVDEATRWCQMFTMREKSEAFTKYKQFQAWLCAQYNITVKVLQSDNDAVFLSCKFEDYLSKNGTTHHLMVHDTPQLNGIAEHMHDTIFAVVRANLASSGLPTFLWGKCLTYALYVYNRRPHVSLDFKSPYEARFGTPPDLQAIHHFGNVSEQTKVQPMAQPITDSHNISEDITQAERPKRQIKPTKRIQGLAYHIEAWVASGGDPIDDPISISEVNKHPDADKWYAAMEVKVASLIKHNTWEYVTPPTGTNLTGLKFVYRTNCHADRSIDKYKVRLVVQGFTQVEGVNYYEDDTRIPVACLSTEILSYAATHDWEIHQIDVKSAYLYGELNEDEEIYARPPSGYQLSGIKPGQVIRLHKALYGLKQAGRCWYQVLCKTLAEIKLKCTQKEEALFYWHYSGEEISIVLSWVDNLILIRKAHFIQVMKQKIGSKVEYVDSGEISWLLGMEVKRDCAQ
ncbi:hypothetical protein ACEPAG_1896 [Sanghuangporus baumii]